MSILRGNRVAWLAVILWAGVLFGLSSIPGRDLPETSVPSADKWVHISLYAVLGLLCFRALRGSSALSPFRALLATVALVLLYGISDELHQIWVPLRSPDPMDAAADLIGGVIGASFMLLVSLERRRGRSADAVAGASGERLPPP